MAGANREMERLIEVLGMVPHPEGGYYREVFRAPLRLAGLEGKGGRSASTSIYYLLPAGTFSAFHFVRGSDEIWHHYLGDPVELHTLSPEHGHEVKRLGPAIDRDERPQVVVPADVHQAAIPLGNGFALCGCTVAPGFDFEDLVMPKREDLLQTFPEHREIIGRLTGG